MRRIFLLIVLLLTLTLLRPAPASAQQGDFPRTVIDLTGQPVLIPHYPAVIAWVSEHPILNQMIASDEQQIILPDAAPDHWGKIGLLILSPLEAAAYPALVESAHTAGIPMFQITPITSLDQWRAAVTQLGSATGREPAAQKMVARQQAAFEAAARWWPGDPAVRVVVLTPEGYTFGQNTLITDLIHAAGGINAAAEAGFADYRQMDDPTLIALSPDVILLTPAWDAPMIAAFSAHPAYAALPAVQAGRVYRLIFSPTTLPDPGAAALLLAFLLHLPD